MKKGYVTVFYTLVISVCLSLILTMIYGVRESCMRLKVIETTDTAMRSVFAEYQKDLWKRYNLLFVDATYGYEMDSVFLTEEHFVETANENLDEKGIIFLNGADLLKLSCVNAETNRIRFATDNNFQELKRQAVRCMKYRYGIKYLEEVSAMCKEAEELGLLDEEEGIESINNLVMDEEYTECPVIKDWVAAEKDIVKDDSNLNGLRTLSMVIPDAASKISFTTLNEEALLSNREINQGNMSTKEEAMLGETLFLKEYLLEYCNNYLTKDPDTVLNYEVEYLIKGNTNDCANLEATVNRILLIRLLANVNSLMLDTEKMNSIKGFSEGAMSLVAMPELAPVLETLIVTGWSYIESLGDLKSLLEGKKVPLIKTSEEWNSGMTSLLLGIISQGDYDEGLEYKDYLRMLLYLTDEDDLLMRFANICEVNIRNDSESRLFRLDYCFDGYDVTAYFMSDYENDFRMNISADYGG